MNWDEYRNKLIELSSKNDECRKALIAFLVGRPMPLGEERIEHDRLRDEYAAALHEYLAFSQEHAGPQPGLG